MRRWAFRLAALGALIAIVTLTWVNSPAGMQDLCLDNGGRWDAAANACTQ